MNEYSYAKLRKAAFEHRCDELADRTAEELADWLDVYGNSWNGEEFDIDDGYSLRPVYDLDNIDEDGVAPIVRWEIR